jgi:protein AroM
MSTIGMVCVGKSPRDDVVPEMRDILGWRVNVVECGALDGLSLKQIQNLTVEIDDFAQETRLPDGTVVGPGMRHVIPRVQECINAVIRKGAKLVVLLCTSEWPEFKSDKIIVYPWKLLNHLTRSLGVAGKVGILSPGRDVGEISDMEKWRREGFNIVVETASCYSQKWKEEIQRAVERIEKKSVEMIVLDCIGYNNEMKEWVKRFTKKPVILPRSLVARIVKEYLYS